MAKFTQIFVEGEGDVKFISDYIAHIVPNSTVEMDNKGKVANISIDGVSKIKVRGLNGWTDIQNVHSEFIPNTTNEEGVNLIIFDADTVENEGGFAKRKQEIEDKNKGLSYEIFLFPNNQDDGALEELLENIIVNNNKPIFDCWDGYEQCLRSKTIAGRAKPLTTPAKKSKIYAYLSALLDNSKKQQDLAKDPNRDYNNAEHWNLDAEYLKPLKDFLLANLQ
jgi:hypothetical protein